MDISSYAKYHKQFAWVATLFVLKNQNIYLQEIYLDSQLKLTL